MRDYPVTFRVRFLGIDSGSTRDRGNEAVVGEIAGGRLFFLLATYVNP